MILVPRLINKCKKSNYCSKAKTVHLIIALQKQKTNMEKTDKPAKKIKKEKNVIFKNSLRRIKKLLN